MPITLELVQVEFHLARHLALGLAVGQIASLYVPGIEERLVKAPEGILALAPRRLCRPEGTQPGDVTFTFYICWLLPDLPLLLVWVVDLGQREITPVDSERLLQRRLNMREPRRGPVDIGSGIVVIDFNSDHCTVPSCRMCGRFLQFSQVILSVTRHS
jgi:hypothetical protein